MIIVSQDKETIVNFQNTTVIGTGVEDKKKICSITTNGNWQELATYPTEERAKEVLQEITKAHKLFETYKVSPEANVRNALMKEMENTNCAMFAYYMPEV